MASGRQKKPSRNQVFQQVKAGWETIPESISMVQKSFLKTGITNALDGNQDDEIAKEEEVTKWKSPTRNLMTSLFQTVTTKNLKTSLASGMKNSKESREGICKFQTAS